MLERRFVCSLTEASSLVCCVYLALIWLRPLKAFSSVHLEKAVLRCVSAGVFDTDGPRHYYNIARNV